MTFEARLLFVLFFFVIWCVLGLFPWALAAVLSRGRGALLAPPLALAGAAPAGVLVPPAGAPPGRPAGTRRRPPRPRPHVATRARGRHRRADSRLAPLTPAR